MDIKVNETPVRTSRNFRINNITINNIDIPKKLNEFKNVDIFADKALIEKDVSQLNLAYGNGEILKENVRNEANNVLKITTNGINKQIRLIYTFDKENLNLINNIEFIINHDSNITILYKSNTNEEWFHNRIIRLIAKDNVKVNISIINMLNNNSYNFDTIDNKLESNSNVKYTIVDFGGKYSVSNYYSNIVGKYAKND